MVDLELLKRIVGYAGLKESDIVLEIGAGTGNLTEWLVKKSKKIYALEKDPDMCDILRAKFDKKVAVLEGDVIKLKFPKFDKCVSNVPYSISRKITVKLLKHKFKLGVLVYQKEFAKKLIAEPGTHEYKYVSALVQSVADIETLEDVHPNSFEPVPNVRSSVVRIKPKKIAKPEYIEFIRDLFNYRNKKLKNLVDNPGDFGSNRPYELTPDELQGLYGLI